MKDTKTDIYTSVTNSIIAALERGVRPWMQPWSATHAAGKIARPLRHNLEPYRGINVLMLWGEAMEKGYSAPIWMTFKQAKELGGNVRKGEKGSLVVYANTLTRSDTDEATGEDAERIIPYLKSYTVFNAEQVEGLPERFTQIATPKLEPALRNAKADQFFAATGAKVNHGGSRAFYSVSEDRIQMPPFEAFRDPESYYATLAHEATHWTRHATRLERDFGRKRWGDAGYAAEELVAELGAAFLCADLDLTPEVRDDHASYIENWLTVLKGDKRAIFTAASYAQKAADFLSAFSSVSSAAEAA